MLKYVFKGVSFILFHFKINELFIPFSYPGFLLFLVTKLPKYYIIVYLLVLLSKARQAKMGHMEMKISQPIFGILVVLTKNELTEICNEPGKWVMDWAVVFLNIRTRAKSHCNFYGHHGYYLDT